VTAPPDQAATSTRSQLRREDLRALGDALLKRADDCWRICEERLEAAHLAEMGMPDVGTEEFRLRRRASQLLGTQLIARYLQDGQGSTAEERAYLGVLGELAARTGVAMFNMTRGYLSFRDVVSELLEEEAAKLGTPAPVLAHAQRMNSRSCEASILWMTRQFDAQRERQDAELAASEARFRGVFDSMASGVVVVAADGTVQSCNEAAAGMLEIPVEKMIGANVFGATSFRDEQGGELRQVPTAEAVATGRPVRGRVIKHEFGDGRPVRWHQVDAIPILDAAGNLTQVLATFSDVTAIKIAEELRAESDAKNRFLATMSHELRTPLNSILGFAQLLGAESGRLDEKQRRYTANIESSGKHLLGLISDILELSRAASGQVVMTLDDVDLVPVITEVMDEFEPMLAKLPIALCAELEPGLRAKVDPARLQQVVENLLSNALKFTEEGSVTVSGRALPDRVEIRVADTGIGIPGDQIERVFDEFTQVDNGWTRSRGGTGLGLPLSRRLVEMMGGLLTLESALGEGTTAVVRLPLP
jgi:PAS domain S-box-containing protein